MEFLKLKNAKDGSRVIVNPNSISTVMQYKKRSRLLMNNGDLVEVYESCNEIDKLLQSLTDNYEVITYRDE